LMFLYQVAHTLYLLTLLVLIMAQVKRLRL
jgi:hypothetical protein